MKTKLIIILSVLMPVLCAPAQVLCTNNLVNFWSTNGSLVNLHAEGTGIAPATNTLAISVGTNTLTIAAPSAGNRWNLDGTLQFDGTSNLTVSLELTANQNNPPGFGFLVISNFIPGTNSFAMVETDAVANMTIAAGNLSAASPIPPAIVPVATDLIPTAVTRVQSSLGVPTSIILSSGGQDSVSLLLKINNVTIWSTNSFEGPSATYDIMALAGAAGLTVNYGDVVSEIVIADQFDSTVAFPWSTKIVWSDGTTNIITGGTNYFSAEPGNLNIYVPNGSFTVSRPSVNTNTATGAVPLILPTKPGVVGYIGSGTSLYIMTNAVLQSHAYASFTTNYAFWKGSNWLARVPNLQRWDLAGGDDGGNPPFGIPVSLVGSYSGSNSWFVISSNGQYNSFTTSNTISIAVITNGASARSVTMVDPGSATLYSVDHPELLGTVISFSGEEVQVATPTNYADVANKGYVDGAIGSALNNNWSSYSASNTYNFVYTFSGQTFVDFLTTTIGIPITNAFLDATGTNFCFQINTNYLGAGYTILSTTNLSQLFTAWTNYTTGTNGVLVTFTNAIVTNAPMRFFEAQISSVSSVNFLVPVTFGVPISSTNVWINTNSFPTVVPNKGLGTSAGGGTATIVTNNGNYSDDLFWVATVAMNGGAANTNLFTVTFGTPLPPGTSYAIEMSKADNPNSGTGMSIATICVPLSLETTNGFSVWWNGAGAVANLSTNVFMFRRYLIQ